MKIRKVNRLILSEEERQVLKNASILIGQIDQVMADNEIDDDISLEDLSYWLDEISWILRGLRPSYFYSLISFGRLAGARGEPSFCFCRCCTILACKFCAICHLVIIPKVWYYIFVKRGRPRNQEVANS